MKVYCRYCKFINLGINGRYICMFRRVYKNSYYDEGVNYHLASYRNKNNDCKDYKPKFLVKLKHFFYMQKGNKIIL